MAKRSVVIAIGIERSGKLPRLPGAARGAKDFAAWAMENAYEVALFTDEGGKDVTFDAIRSKVEEFVDALDVGRLILFFAGHGCASAAETMWLLSKYDRRSDEVVGVEASEKHARRCGIDQVSFISDACRNSVPGQPFFTPRSLFQRQQRIATPAQWDHFEAADIDGAAQEVAKPATETEPAEHYGVFTSCLMQALKGNVSAAFARPRGEGPCVTSASLATFLEKAVAYETDLLAGARPQRVDANSGWREPNDVYVSFPKGHIILSTSPLDRKERGFEIHHFRLDAPSERGSLESWTPPRPKSRKSVASDRIRRLRERSNGRLRRRRAKFAAAEGRASFETHVGVTVIGSSIARVATRPEYWRFSDGGADQIAVRTEVPATLLLETAEGDFVAVLVVPGFVATLVVEKGAAASLSYAPSVNGGFARACDLYRETITPAVHRLTAEMEAKRTPDANAVIALLDALRAAGVVDPGAGVLAAHALEQAGRIAEIRELAQFFAATPDEYGRGPIGTPFDVAYLADSEAAAVGAFPLLTKGWAYLEPDDSRVSRIVLEARRGLKPSLWTTFDAAAGAMLAAEIDEGRLA